MPALRHAQFVMRAARADDIDELVRIDDERLSFVTIPRVEVDSEMNRGVVYFDSLSGEEGDAEIIEALDEHRIRLQSSVGRQVRAKKTPILSFRPDEVIRSAEHIDRILAASETLPERPPSPDGDDADDGSA